MKKEIEKNLEKEKKELKALEKMKDLAVTNSKMGKPESFQGQILECQKRIQDHERKIAQVDSWLGLEPQQTSQGKNITFICMYRSTRSFSGPRYQGCNNVKV